MNTEQDINNISHNIKTLVEFTKNSSKNMQDTISEIGANTPEKVQVIGMINADGKTIPVLGAENGAVAVGNGIKKFRDGFADLVQGEAPDPTIWDIELINTNTSTIDKAGDAQGSSYMKISMCPITPGAEISMTTKKSFKYPMRFINMLSLSQRVIGQEFEVSLVGVDSNNRITLLAPKPDLTILGTVTIAFNVATINFATVHGLKTSDRVILIGNTERRLNVGPVQVTVINATQITVPCTMTSGTYTAGGAVRWADPLAYAKNGAGLLHENTTSTNATFFTRRNGYNTRLLNSTIATTANTVNVPYADPFNATSMNQFIANQEEFIVIPRSADSSNASGLPLKWNQCIPDEELEYKIRIRAKNLDNMSIPIAKIISIVKTGTTTATVTTDVPHGLAVTDFIQIQGVRDATNFPNLSAQSAISSIISPTQFTIVIGTASTSSSAGGFVFLNQGSVTTTGIVFGPVIQSISRTNNILTVIGNGTWTALPGQTVQLHGCNATSMGLYDGVYKVLKVSTTALELESMGANFASINCGGAIILRTDFRIHAVSQIEYTRHLVELSNSQGALDSSKSIPVSVQNTTSVSQSSGTWYVSNPISTVIADIASGAITSSATVSAIIPGFGSSYEVNIPVTAVSGTNPTMDVSIEESDDNGTNWFKVYDFPRITATGMYRSPKLLLTGNRVRYVQTLTGTSPSFTRTLNRLQCSDIISPIRQLIDRSIVLTTLNSVTPVLNVQNCDNLQMNINIGAATTSPALQLEGSDDNGLTWTAIGTPQIAVDSSTVSLRVVDINVQLVRARVSTVGVGVTAGHVLIKGY